MQGAGKTNVMLAVFLLMMLLLLQEGEASEWSYENVTDWPTSFPDYCSGSKQSPVNIDRFQTSFRFMGRIKFKNYDVTPESQSAANNGHSVSVTQTYAADLPSISKSGLPGSFSFHSYHFHWGSDDTKGSEHTINSVRYPMELHLIHTNDKYSNINEAVEHDDGLAVLGIMFKITADDNRDLTDLIDTFGTIKAAGHTAEFTKMPLKALLPDDLSMFYRYEGGLTTPTCNEVVIWTVFEGTSTVSQAQLEKFRELEDGHGHQIQNNFRPPQDLNGRKVCRSYLF